MVKVEIVESVNKRPYGRKLVPEHFFRTMEWGARKVDYWCRVYDRKPPVIKWSYDESIEDGKGFTFFCAQKGKPDIHVTMGSNEMCNRSVILHELAHWLAPKAHHSSKFYRMAFELYMAELPHDFVREYAAPREIHYMKGALAVAREFDVAPGEPIQVETFVRMRKSALNKWKNKEDI